MHGLGEGLHKFSRYGTAQFRRTHQDAGQAAQVTAVSVCVAPQAVSRGCSLPTATHAAPSELQAWQQRKTNKRGTSHCVDWGKCISTSEAIPKGIQGIQRWYFQLEHHFLPLERLVMSHIHSVFQDIPAQVRVNAVWPYFSLRKGWAGLL